MAIGNARILTFDTGIERIISGGEPAAPPLPERNALTPTGEPPRARLDEILNAPASDEQLRASLRPHIADKSILAPVRYQTLLDEVRAELRERAGEARDALAQAATLLDEEQQVRELFNTLRTILVRA